MGVAGCGKSTVAAAARGPPRRVVHRSRRPPQPPRTSRRWRRASPLTDDDRWPWLAAIRRAMRAEHDVVVACSALRRAYRDALRARGRRPLLLSRRRPRRGPSDVSRRGPGHFMGAAMVDSQFDGTGGPRTRPRSTSRRSTPPVTPTSCRRPRSSGAGDAPGRHRDMRRCAASAAPATAISHDELRDLVAEIASHRRSSAPAPGACCSFRPTSPGCTRGPGRSQACSSRARARRLRRRACCRRSARMPR